MLQLLWFGKKTISNTLSIHIKTNTGNTLSVDLNPEWDIKNVKEIVAPKLGLQPEEVKIIFAGKELSDNITISVGGFFELLVHVGVWIFYFRNVIWVRKVYCTLWK